MEERLPAYKITEDIPGVEMKAYPAEGNIDLFYHCRIDNRIRILPTPR